MERLCRALQKERNDLNNQLGLLQEQGDKDITALEDQPQRPPARQEEGHGVKGLAQTDGLEKEQVDQAPRLSKLDSSLATAEKNTVVMVISKSAEMVNTQQD